MATKRSMREDSSVEEAGFPTSDYSADQRDAIEQRAYEISISGDSASDEENWLRAEREIRQALRAT